MTKVLLNLVFFFILIGCNKSHKVEIKVNDSFSKEYENYRSGMVQINGAAEVIEEMLEKASQLKKNIPSSSKKYLHKIIEQIDEARACLSDQVEDPISFEKYKKKPPVKQEIVNAANDAIHELNDIYEIIEEAPKNNNFNQLEIFTDESIKNLEESIITLGGKIDE